MENKQVVTGIVVEHQGKRIEPEVSRFQLMLRRAEVLRRDLVASWQASHAQAEKMVLGFVYGNMAVNPQTGNAMITVLIGAGVVVLGLALFATRGLPQIYTITSNTTAMTTAGMSTDAIQWVTWATWGIILLVIGGVIMLVVKKYSGSGATGGGGGGRRSRRRR